MNNNNPEKEINLRWYCYFLLTMFFIKANPYMNSTKVALVMMGISVIVGGYISLKFLFKQGIVIVRNKYFLLSVAFMLSYSISIIVNYQYSLLENIKDLVWYAILMFSIFLPYQYRKSELVRKDLTGISIMYIIYSFVFAAGSMYFVFSNTGGIETYGKWGILSNRLIGLYRSPNYGALYCVIAIILTIGILYLHKSKIDNKFYKIFLWINIIVNYLYVVYSGSNTGIVALGCAIVVIYGLTIVTEKKERLKKIVPLMGLALVIIVSGFLVIPDVTANTLNKVDKVDNNEGVVISFERTDAINGVDNGRIDHWEQALEIFPNKPIFGTTIRGFQKNQETIYSIQYVEKVLKYQLLVNEAKWNDDVACIEQPVMPILEAYTIENDFLTLLVCTGIVGFLLFAMIIIYTIIMMVMVYYKLFKDKRYNVIKSLTGPLAVVVCVAVTMLFTDAVVFTNVLQSLMFWIFLSYFISCKNDANIREG